MLIVAVVLGGPKTREEVWFVTIVNNRHDRHYRLALRTAVAQLHNYATMQHQPTVRSVAQLHNYGMQLATVAKYAQQQQQNLNIFI